MVQTSEVLREWRRLALVALVALLATLAAFGGPGHAQDAAPDTEAPLAQLREADGSLSPQTVRDLVARLDDAEVRALLLERLDAVAAGETTEVGFNPAQLMLDLNDEAQTVRDRFAAMIAAVVDLPGVVPTAVSRLLGDRPPSLLLWIALGFALMLAVGWLAERLFGAATRGLRASVLAARPDTLAGRLGYLALRLALDVAALGIFIVAAISVFFALYQGHEMTRITVMTYVAAIGVVRVVILLSRFFLSPHEPALRLTHMTDDQAAYLHRQNVILVCIAAFGFFTCSLVNLLGVVGPVHQLLTFLVGVAFIGTLVHTIRRARPAIAGDLRGDEPIGRARRTFADLWPGITIAFTLVFYVTVVLLGLADARVSYLAAFGTLLTVLFVPHLDAMIERAARRHQEEAAETGQFQAVVMRAGRIALLVVAALFVARAWDVSLFSVAERGMGSQFAGALTDIGLTALVAYVLWQAATIAIDRKIAAEGGPARAAEMGDEGGGAGSRLGTLLPLLKRTVQTAVGVMAVMIVLSSLGVNIGPLLAGAGVIGLAIGFGAQTLVRDIVSGLFFLVDDAFRVGEYIDVGAAKGTVEKISVRSLRLRHHRGALNTVPFGEIQTLTNYSRDWVVMKLEFRVPFDADIQKIKKIFKQIGKELMQDPELGKDFLAPFKSQGVYSVDDSALVIRAKFTAKPGRQFLIRREAYAAVQKAFAEHGIRFADRRVTVAVPGAEQMTPEQRQQAERAAAAALSEDREAPQGAATHAAE